MAQETGSRTYHRLNLQTWENAEGTEGWRIRDRRTGEIICKGSGRTVNVWRRFLAYETMEARLCAEIDREWPDTEQRNDTYS